MGGESVFVAMDEAEQLARRLADEILRSVGQPELLVGLANGALFPTKIAAEHLGVRYEMVKIRRQGSRIKQRLQFLKKAFGIPGSIITSRPLAWFWRRFEHRYSGLEQAEDAFNFGIDGRSIVIVDDEMVTGNSVRRVRSELHARGGRELTIAVLNWYRGKGDSGSFAPDIFLAKEHRYFPWSNNSPYYREFEAWLRANRLHLWR